MNKAGIVFAALAIAASAAASGNVTSPPSAQANPNVDPEWQPHEIKTGVTWSIPRLGTGPRCLEAEIPSEANPNQTVATSVCKNDDGLTYRTSYLEKTDGEWVGLRATPPDGVSAKCWLVIDGSTVRDVEGPVGQSVDCLKRV